MQFYMLRIFSQDGRDIIKAVQTSSTCFKIMRSTSVMTLTILKTPSVPRDPFWTRIIPTLTPLTNTQRIGLKIRSVKEMAKFGRLVQRIGATWRVNTCTWLQTWTNMLPVQQIRMWYLFVQLAYMAQNTYVLATHPCQAQSRLLKVKPKRYPSKTSVRSTQSQTRSK